MVLFKGPFAKIIEYKEYADSLKIVCPICKWQGKAINGEREYYRDLFDVSCPKCDQMILIVSYPLVREAEKSK